MFGAGLPETGRDRPRARVREAPGSPHPRISLARVPPGARTAQILEGSGPPTGPAGLLAAAASSPCRGLGPSPTPRTGGLSGSECSPTFSAEARASRRQRGAAAAASLRERVLHTRSPPALRAAVPWSAT